MITPVRIGTGAAIIGLSCHDGLIGNLFKLFIPSISRAIQLTGSRLLEVPNMEFNGGGETHSYVLSVNFTIITGIGETK
jgi:hypothetical protein